MSEDGLKYFPLLIDRWIAGTRHMTFEEQGAYLQILLYLYEGNGPIKDDKHAIRILSMASVTPRNARGLATVWSRFAHKFARNQHGYYHVLVNKLLRNGGRISGLDGGAHRGACRGAKEEHFPTVPVPVPVTPVVPFTVPTGVDSTAWAEFEQHRKEIRKPLTKLSRTKAANQLAGLTPEQQRRCVDMTIQNRWQGLFPEKVRNGEPSASAGDEDWRNNL